MILQNHVYLIFFKVGNFCLFIYLFIYFGFYDNVGSFEGVSSYDG
jgi:hypothetical protein